MPNVAKRIIRKQPSPDLFAGMKDEEIMGISYEKLDAVLRSLSNGMIDAEIEQMADVVAKSINYVSEMRCLSERLRECPASLIEA